MAEVIKKSGWTDTVKAISPIVLAIMIGIMTYFSTVSRAETTLSFHDKQITANMEQLKQMNEGGIGNSKDIQNINTNIKDIRDSIQSITGCIQLMQQDIAVLKSKGN